MYVRTVLSTVLLGGLAFLAINPSAGAQEFEGPVFMAHFVTVASEDVADFEEAAREHNDFHAEQNDPWSWVIFQAMTGKGAEYVAVTPNHTWSDFDDPPVDMAADMAHWAETGAPYEQSTESVIWVDIPEVSNPPADGPMPIVQVIEWEVHAGGEEAIMRGIQKYKEAVDEMGLDFTYVWSRIASREGPPGIMLALWSDSFSEWDQEIPGPEEIMGQVHGEFETQAIFEAMEDAWTQTGSRIWVFRPDLSHVPGM